MNIVVCGDCFWIGHDADVTNIKIEQGGPLHKIIISNDLVLQICPKCGGSKILRKLVSSNNNVQVPGVCTDASFDSDPNVQFNTLDENEDNDIVSDLLDSAEKTTENFNPRPRPRRPAPKYKEHECVDCGEKFNSREESSRCDECNIKFMKQYAK